MEVAGEQCQVVGNRFLLNIPDKVAVIVHRRYTDEENARLREEWLSCGECGGVLVSAAVSPKEKEVLREAMNRGYNIILLRENGFPKLYKPSGEAFDACAKGLLLQISPWDFHYERRVITREQCLRLVLERELNGSAPSVLGLKLEVGMTVNVHLVVDARKWQTQQGEDRYENRVTITNIARWE
jgi:hypothetical protein